jgi:hypothetical protein
VAEIRILPFFPFSFHDFRNLGSTPIALLIVKYEYKNVYEYKYM